ncbi:MAG: hypothetical protein GXY50_02245 [Syntrophomonadaceae bacterium]|nr:hypothetical protein [Syntrophomonadaceae bacterium]
MKQLELDSRTQRDIIDEIKEKAAGYTPEWRMDEENPDIGTALALVYANMFAKTVKSFNKAPLKNKIAFFNHLGAELLPTIPSTGYVAFSLVNDEVPGIEVPLGTIVSADTDDEIGVVEFETTDDLYVTPAQVDVIFQSDDNIDFIEKIYSISETDEGLPERDREMEFFNFSGTNLQEHTLIFSHDQLLNLKKSAWIELCFYYRETRLVPEEILRQLVLDDNARIEYYSEQGYAAFADKSVRDGNILLYKNEKQPSFAPMEIGGRESYVIKCTVHNISMFKDMEVERFLMRAKGMGISCDTITSNGVECNQAQFFPFGERFNLYNEVYFGSEEVLCKKSAMITISFNLNYVSIPLEYNAADDPMEWKWITDRSSFRPNREYDLTIEEVIWEYFNGSGWARLFNDSSFADLFSTENGAIGQYKTISFICPEDISPILINAAESYYIRARVLKINNLYKIMGNYISPVLTNTGLSYDYGDTWLLPEHITSSNNLETVDMTSQDMLNLGGFKPFASTGLNKAAVYLGFDVAPQGAPIKLLVTMRDSTERESSTLTWEYYDGSKWGFLNMVDETEGFLHSGLIILMDNRAFAKSRQFGEEKYWIRIVDENNFYSGENIAFPSIQSLHMNATGIVNVDQRATESFTMEIYQENMNFKLLYNHITEISVYINESDDLSEEQLRQLKADRAVRCVYNEAGLLQEAWVRWERADDFLNSLPMDRHYVSNRTEGYILFGNGKYGRIPSASQEPNIIVEYKTGGGRRTNLPAEAVQKMDRSIGFINHVSNPAKLSGGYDVESLTEAIERNSSMLRTQGKAVTARDFEELVKYATRNVQMVKCFAGYDASGNKKSGAVTLVVLRSDYQISRTQFAPVRDEIYRYLEDKISGNLIALKKLSVIEPKFVEMRVRAEIRVRDMNQVFSVKKSVQERLDQFMNVVNGNFDGSGWKIGRLPNKIQIRNAIIDINGIEYVKNIFITAFTSDATGWKETDMEIIKSNRYVLPLSGEHEILISVG